MKLTMKWPIRTYSETNQREHWAAKSRRVKKMRADAAMLFPKCTLPLTITLTRRALRQLDDDNLPPAFKAIRDGIADKLGIADNDPRVTWRYMQERSAQVRDYAVIVHIGPRA